MSPSRTSYHNVLDHVHQGHSANYGRISRWIQDLESFRSSTTPSVEDNRTLSGMTATPSVANETWYETAIRERLLGDEPLENTLSIGPTPPLAPLMRPIPLPPVEEEMRAEPLTPTTLYAIVADHHPFHYRWIAATDRSSRRSRTHHRQHVVMQSSVDIPTIQSRTGFNTTGPQWHLDTALRYHPSIRPIVNPVLSDMPPYPGHCWGAVDEQGSSIDELHIHFACSGVPATNPPMARIRLVRPFGGILVVTPTIGNQFVSVGDVQKAVIAWMRFEQPHVQDEGIQLRGKKVVWARDGTTREVDVWIWRGLTRVNDGTNIWKINL